MFELLCIYLASRSPGSHVHSFFSKRQRVSVRWDVFFPRLYFASLSFRANVDRRICFFSFGLFFIFRWWCLRRWWCWCWWWLWTSVSVCSRWLLEIDCKWFESRSVQWDDRKRRLLYSFSCLYFQHLCANDFLLSLSPPLIGIYSLEYLLNLRRSLHCTWLQDILFRT